MALPPHPRRAEAEALLRAGTPRAEVAARVGASLRAVQGWARRLGIAPEGRGPGELAEQIAAQVIERLLQGEAPPQVAAALGITAARVRQIRAASPIVTDGERK